MPTFVPRNGAKARRKPWFARAKVAGEHFSLGYFLTREEAEAVEREFKAAFVTASSQGSKRTVLGDLSHMR